MSCAVPPEDPAADEECDPLQGQSRRFTVVAALLLAGGIVAAAWAGGERQGLDQIGQSGVNLSLLPKVGDPAPDLATTIVDPQGHPLARARLSDWRGQPVWLNFWGSWCPPCRAEMPEIQAAYAQLEPQGFVWLAVSLDEPAGDAAGLTVHVLFALVGQTPTARPALGEQVGFAIDYTFWLNLVFLIIGAALLTLHFRRPKGERQLAEQP